MRRRPRIARTALAGVALLAAGCGGSSGISEAQLRARAGRACMAAAESLHQLHSPRLPRGAGAFLSHGIAVIAPEVAELARLHPSGDVEETYRTALDASLAELTALRHAVRSIHANADPVATVRELQRRLTPLEARAGAAWTTLGLSACSDS